VFYKPYINQLNAVTMQLNEMEIDFDPNGTLDDEQYQKDKLKGYGTYFITNVINKYLKVSLSN
jgi:hypothetical protein